VIALLAALLVFLPWCGLAVLIERCERRGWSSWGTWRS
jgi:hypothetical protein